MLVVHAVLSAQILASFARPTISISSMDKVTDSQVDRKEIILLFLFSVESGIFALRLMDQMVMDSYYTVHLSVQRDTP